MKRHLLMLSFIAYLFCGCEEVIDLPLKDAETKYVIEANLTDQRGTSEVRISQTTNFNADGKFNGVSGATVTISGDQLVATTLTETAKGVYTHPTLKGISDKTYLLTVIANGQTFTADCTMPKLVPLDSVFLREVTFFDGPEIFTYVSFQDPLGLGNCYRFKQYINGEYNKQIAVADDDLFDGRYVNQSLRPRDFDDERTLQKNDTVKVEMMTIAKPLYQYWFSARSGATGGGNTASPINPVTNIKGGALGYFSAHTLQTQSYILK